MTRQCHRARCTVTGIRASGLTCGTVYVLARSTVAHTAHGLLSASVRYVIKRGHFATDGPRLAAMTRAARETRARPAPSAVHCAQIGQSGGSLSGVKSPTRSSVTVSSNLRHARRTSTAPSVACSSLRLKLGEQLLCCSHALHSWHSPLCGCHSCDSDGLALTGPQSLVLRLV